MSRVPAPSRPTVPSTIPTDAERVLLRRVELGAILLATLAVTLATALFFYRVALRPAAVDFTDFVAAGRYALEHRARDPNSILIRFLPSMDAVWALAAMMPIAVAATLYTLSIAAVFALLLRLLQREFMPSVPVEFRRMVVASAVLLGMVAIAAHIAIGAFHIAMVYFMLAGVLAATRGRWMIGGALLGVAICIKLLPLLGVAYLLMKRRFAAAATAVVLATVANGAISLVAYGPQRAMDAHRHWLTVGSRLDLDAVYSTGVGGHAQSARNQSLAGLIRRLLAPPAASTHRDEARDVAIVHASSDAIRVVHRGAIAAIALALLWYWRLPLGSMTQQRLVAELSILSLATIWLSPVAWTYHFTAALPALASTLGSRWERSAIKKAAVAGWLLGSVAMASVLARSLAVGLWATVLLAVAVAWRTGDNVDASGEKPDRFDAM